jgi:hypothetical protein
MKILLELMKLTYSLLFRQFYLHYIIRDISFRDDFSKTFDFICFSLLVGHYTLSKYSCNTAGLKSRVVEDAHEGACTHRSFLGKNLKCPRPQSIFVEDTTEPRSKFGVLGSLADKKNCEPRKSKNKDISNIKSQSTVEIKQN